MVSGLRRCWDAQVMQETDVVLLLMLSVVSRITGGFVTSVLCPSFVPLLWGDMSFSFAKI